MLQRVIGLTLGAATLLGLTAVISYCAQAQGTAATTRSRTSQQAPGASADDRSVYSPETALAQAQQPGGPGGFGGRGGFGPGGPGFPGGPGGMMGMMGGGQLTATSTAVYVLRGNTLMAFDARTLKQVAQAELPMPQPPPGFAPGGPGFPGAPGGQRPGGGN